MPTTLAPTSTLSICTPNSNVCGTRSDFSGGFRLTFYEYYAGDKTAGGGGAAHYCPGGTWGSASCDQSCTYESTFRAQCIACCTACCKTAIFTSRTL
ncbi:unnamed protein product [Adineta steineri]|uniref:Uncharacterized protein n=1 Tax=Adineta steineri TaxID=433720 RepID=A0A814RUI4_9BILA|nr:unnamed protein product [Adineta steineri]CAF4000706.1 unnamed protein product [Adineta steineri]